MREKERARKAIVCCLLIAISRGWFQGNSEDAVNQRLCCGPMNRIQNRDKQIFIQIVWYLIHLILFCCFIFLFDIYKKKKKKFGPFLLNKLLAWNRHFQGFLKLFMFWSTINHFQSCIMRLLVLTINKIHIEIYYVHKF